MDSDNQLQYLFDHIREPAADDINLLMQPELLGIAGARMSLYSFDWLPQITWGLDYLGHPIYAFKSFKLPEIRHMVHRSALFHFAEYTLIYVETTSGEVMLFIRDADTEAIYYISTYARELTFDILLDTDGLIVNTFNW